MSIRSRSLFHCASIAASLLLPACAGSTPPSEAHEDVGASHQPLSGGLQVWGIDNGYHAVSLASDGTWTTEDTTTQLKQIAVGKTTWAIAAGNVVLQWSGSAWQQMPGQLLSISSSADGSVWGVDANTHHPVRWGASAWQQMPGSMSQVSVGSATQVWAVDVNQRIYQWSASAWQQIPGTFTSVSVGNDGTVCALSPSGVPYQLHPGNVWLPLVGDIPMREISVVSAAEIWGVTGSRQAVELVDGVAWVSFDGNVSQVSASGPAPAPSTRVGQFFRSALGTAQPLQKPDATYWRNANGVAQTCDDGYELWAGTICYPTCQSGYIGIGPECVQECPSGYTDMGVYCQAPTQGKDCPDYDPCGAEGCGCPDGWTDELCFCQLGEDTTKGSYSRGAGEAAHCPSGEDEDTGMCFPQCEPGYQGEGPTCFLGSFASGACQELYDSTLASGAITEGTVLTFGIGAGAEAGVSMGGEVGVAYGPNGEYGCYTMVCEGVSTNAAITAWGSSTVQTIHFSQLVGTTYVVDVAGGDVAGVEGGAILNSSGDLIGALMEVSLGIGVLPVEAGASECTTSM